MIWIAAKRERCWTCPCAMKKKPTEFIRQGLRELSNESRRMADVLLSCSSDRHDRRDQVVIDAAVRAGPS